MRPKSGAFSRYRPRVLTLIVLIVVAAPTVLANLSSEIVRDAGPLAKGTYGWPLMWHWHNLVIGPDACGIVGWEYSASRLAGNLAMWLVMLAAPGVACEWLLRRYRPRLRWSLRTMLAAVGLVAVCCAWCAAIRNRANMQDPLIAELAQDVYVERWGPQWLDFVVADRFRRRIVGVKLDIIDTDDEELFKRLGRLPDLRYLDVEVSELTPSMTTALAEIRQLRMLRIMDGKQRLLYHNPRACDNDEGVLQKCLAAVGKLIQLEELHLDGTKIAGDGLACLAGLTNLKTLRLEVSDVIEPASEQALLAHLPALPRLEAVDLGHAFVIDDHDLRHLAILPRLKSLNLTDTCVTDAGLAELASLESLEELAIDNEIASAAGLESLRALKRLKSLHIDTSWPQGKRERALERPEALPINSGDVGSKFELLAPLALDHGDEIFALKGETDGLRRALDALRQSNSGIVIDSDTDVLDRRGELTPSWRYDASPDRLPTWLPAQLPWFPPSFLGRLGLQGPGPADQSAQEESESDDE